MIEINRSPGRRDLRIFAVGVAVLAGIAGAWVRRRFGVEAALPAGLACGALVAGAGVVRPESLRRLYVGWMIAVSPIGLVVSYALLAIVYYGVVTPIALWQRLRGRDALELKFDRQAPTYWRRRPADPEPESYFRTF